MFLANRQHSLLTIMSQSPALEREEDSERGRESRSKERKLWEKGTKLVGVKRNAKVKLSAGYVR